jgi:DNA-directed RNA polymerase subunit L
MPIISGFTQTSNEFRFTLNNTQQNVILPAFGNVLRSMIQSSIPSISIDIRSINFIRNSSFINNDKLGGRLALIPFKHTFFTDKTIQDVIIRISKENTTDNDMSYYTRDCEVVNSDDTLFDSNTVFVYNDIIIGILEPGQVIEFTAHVHVGTPLQYGAKMLMTNTVACSYKPSVVLLEKKVKDAKLTGNDKVQFEHIHREQTYELSTHTQTPKAFNFLFQINGNLSGHEMILQVCSIIIKKLETLITNISTKDVSKINIIQSNRTFESFNFNINNMLEDNTLFYVISKYLSFNNKIEFAGASDLYDSDDLFIISTALKQNNTLDNNIEVFQSEIVNLIALFQTFKTEWSVQFKKKKTKK